jgi:hypothetical protein
VFEKISKGTKIMLEKTHDDGELNPVNKMVSDFPLPMRPGRARYEAQRARFHGWELPRGHPYYRVPPMVPYLPAYLISRVTSLLSW